MKIGPTFKQPILLSPNHGIIISLRFLLLCLVFLQVFFSKFDSLQGNEERPSRAEDRRGTNERERRSTNDRDRRPTGERDRRPTDDRDRNPRNDRGTSSSYNRDANSNGHHNGYEDIGRDAYPTGEQKWYTHVGRTEVMQERRHVPSEERIDGPHDGGHRYKVRVANF